MADCRPLFLDKNNWFGTDVLVKRLKLQNVKNSEPNIL